MENTEHLDNIKNNPPTTPKTIQAEREIKEFIENPQNNLALNVGWVAQKQPDFPKHLLNDDDTFLCGTKYVYDENLDGNLMRIAIIPSNKSNEITHSVSFIFSDLGRFILCAKCLKWLRKQLEPLRDLNNYE